MPAPQNNVLRRQQYWMDQGLRDERLQDYCMHKLGYHLAPAGD
jgi:hypothetical protein